VNSFQLFNTVTARSDQSHTSSNFSYSRENLTSFSLDFSSPFIRPGGNISAIFSFSTIPVAGSNSNFFPESIRSDRSSLLILANPQGDPNVLGCCLVATGNTFLNQASLFHAILQKAVKVQAGGTTIIASFEPNFGLSLAQAAALGGFTGFNWQQTVTHLPNPNPFRLANGTPLTTPFLDPPAGGYATSPGPTGNPFYYSQAQLNGGVIQNDGKILTFLDQPADNCLAGGSGKDCNGLTSKAGDAIFFTTDLVGVLPGNQVGSKLYEFTWKDDFNGVTLLGQSALKLSGA